MGFLNSIKEGINDVKINSISDESLNIYPNPNNGQFSISFDNPAGKTMQISVYDITGKEIFETLFTGQTYFCNGNLLQSGIYIVSVKSDDYYKISKVIVK